MTIHKVGVDEWRLARAVRLDALAESRCGVFGSAFEVASAWDEGQWRSWMGRQVLFVAEADGSLLGSAGGLIDDEAPSVASVWVCPAARGTGFSDLLVGAVVDWARANGHHQLRLWFTEGNAHARALYLRLGFTNTGRKRRDMDDPSIAEVEMALPLISVSRTASRSSTQFDVRLRLLGPHDEQQFLAVRARLHSDGFDFAKDYRSPWTSYLDRLDRSRRGIDLDQGAVPSTFLMAEDGAGQIIGSSDIRHHLTERLMHWGGHIGYVVPDQRRLGYATEILGRTLLLANDLGIDRARMTCRSDNVASRRVITACGGDLDTITSDGICQYWLPT
ncbi:GNAT family N-acetyltransferase [Nocardia sp. NBC_00565]|uniref:GNAT family N-acetyltransferase n=1 Tax=Nocardia sp. NBC_00565 TaxID=2975993 RepID=UPI002E8201A4|nr:GNAT family N-acetyltransferase [Nocardia sp. NBC_00565]WUC02022.1 GNAT family N-acetyltransferase [Nocardia sp. NBC_00565]